MLFFAVLALAAANTLSETIESNLAFALPQQEQAQLKAAVDRGKGIYVSQTSAPSALALHAAQNTVMLTTCNDGWMHMLRSFGCALRDLGIKGLLFVQDTTMLERLQQEQASAKEQTDSFQSTLTPYFSPTFAKFYNVGTQAANFKKKQFNRAGVLKLHAVLVVLRLGVNVWLSDMDVAFIRDPWPAWNLELLCDMDMVAYFTAAPMSHETFRDFTTGFFRARANHVTIKFLQEAIELSAKKPGEVEQLLANIVFRKWKASNRTLFLQQLDSYERKPESGEPRSEHSLRWCTVTQCTHPNGLLRLSADQVNKWRAMPSGKTRPTVLPTVFHPNFLVGVGTKVQVLNNSGLWSTYSSSSGCLRSSGLGPVMDPTPRFGRTWDWPGKCTEHEHEESYGKAVPAADDNAVSAARNANVECNSKFYAFDFNTFEQAFPALRACAFSSYGHVIDEITRLQPQLCRVQSPADADFILPPPYFFHDHNWPIYCKKVDRDVNAAYRNRSSGSLVLSPLVNESGDPTAIDWKIDVTGMNFKGSTKDPRCDISRFRSELRGVTEDTSNSCVHVAAWPTRFTHAAFPAIEDMLLNESAWKRLFGVDLAAGAKLVMVHHAQTPVSGGLVEWEQYPLPSSVYQAPHVIWAKISSRTWYELGVNTRNAAVYRPGLDISFPPSAQAVAAKLAKLPLQPMSTKPILMGFLGNLVYPKSHVRQKLARLHSGKADIKILSTRGATSNPMGSYAAFMTNTSFALILRGDTRQTHRMIDCICAGGVPVLLTDFMVPPFNETIPWETFGILVNETAWNETEAILRAVPMERREQLQQAARRACLDFFVSAPRQIQHMLDTITARPRRSIGIRGGGSSY